MTPVVEQALSRYALAAPKARLLAHHTNTLFRVEAAQERYVLRVSAPGLRTELEIRSELAWLAALTRDTDLIVPEPVATRNGQRVITAGAGPDARFCVLFKWVPGRVVGERVTAGLLREAGSALARLHDHAERFKPRGAFSTTRLDRAWPFGAPDMLSHDRRLPGWPKARRALLLEAAARVQTWFDGLYTDPRGLRFLHLDFHPGNWKRVDGQLAVLDFDDTRWAYPVQDLGIALYYLLDGPSEPVLMGAFLDGYARVRPSAVPDAGELQLAVIARQLDLLSYVMAHNVLAGPDLTRWLGVVEGRLRRIMK
ncbi:MAG: phosphotransferase [Anaerolineales bacterium]|nr:phosphotransferase [Anaerolineales bacterium]